MEQITSPCSFVVAARLPSRTGPDSNFRIAHPQSNLPELAFELRGVWEIVCWANSFEQVDPWCRLRRK
jgi:hypothetical protein